MAKKSANPGPDRGIQFGKLDLPPPQIALEQSKMASKDEGVSVSLKYFRQSVECFSQWSAVELKKFSASLSKMRQLNSADLRNFNGLCKRHKNKPFAKCYTRPDDLSTDLDMFEIKVDAKARIHGVFVGSVFYLVWLDRDHMVFPFD